MRFLRWGCFFLFVSISVSAAPEDSVKFTPTLRTYECPANFVYRSDCKMTERKLEPQKLVLNLDLLNRSMGQWSMQTADPVPASHYVIVLRGRAGKQFEYSVSTESGLPGSPAPFANARIEFTDASVPNSFGVGSATIEKDGKKYLTEIRLSDFHGKAVKR
ncbi:MAG TPA: hypothetical protein VIH99_05930 [Bdellovibrionota bacterium]|jgi:hypothetical protein